MKQIRKITFKDKAIELTKKRKLLLSCRVCRAEKAIKQHMIEFLPRCETCKENNWYYNNNALSILKGQL